MRVLVAVLITAGLSVAGLQAPANAGADRDCSDFASQQAAQLFFLNNNPSADPHNLDGDGDGVVCESQGPPYYYGSDPTPGGGGSTPPPPSKPQPIKVVKVLEGDLLLLRQGTKPAYKVRLLGAAVRGNSCMRNGARRNLKAWIKPGRVVSLDVDPRAPRRDKQGNLLAEVIDKRRNWTIPVAQIVDGWAVVPEYRFKERAKYKRWARYAEYTREGYYGECVSNFGTKSHPYAVGTSFDMGPWRYSLAATDGDAFPEMQAEKAASPGSVTYVSGPPPGWVYIRVAATITRIGAGSGEAERLFWHLLRDDGKESYTDFGPVPGNWCGTGSGYVNNQVLSQGQSMTGYVCATIPAPLQPQDAWVIGSEDLRTERWVAVR